MVTTSLVEAELNTGRRLYQSLKDDARFGLKAAFWSHDTDADEWRLVVASTEYDKRGPKAAYSHINQILKKIDRTHILPLSRIVAVSPKNSLIIELSTAYAKRFPGARISRLASQQGGVALGDSFVYEVPVVHSQAAPSGGTNRLTTPRRHNRDLTARAGNRVSEGFRPKVQDQSTSHVSQAQADDTLGNPDQVHDIRQGDMLVRLFTKQIDDTTILVAISSKPNKDDFICFSVLIRNDLIPGGVSELPPLELLEAFVVRFGLMSIIAGRRRKFFLEAEVPLPANMPQRSRSATQLHQVQNPSNHSFFSVTNFRIQQNKVEIALAFAVDVTEYEEWLARSR